MGLLLGEQMKPLSQSPQSSIVLCPQRSPSCLEARIPVRQYKRSYSNQTFCLAIAINDGSLAIVMARPFQ